MAKSDFHELYVEQDVLAGGVWVDPDGDIFIQVIDMGSATGDEGVTTIEKGIGVINEETVRKGLEMSGLFTLEAPPQPRRRTGRKAWDPTRRRRDPAPKPGHLFWKPDVPEGFRIMDTWLAFSESQEPFIKFTEEAQEDLLRALEGAFAYMGFDGSPDNSVVVIDRSSDVDQRNDPRWGPNAIISRNPEKAVWRELKKMGVEKPDAN